MAVKCVLANFAGFPTLVFHIVFSLESVRSNNSMCVAQAKNCHKNGKNPLLFQFIRKAIEWTVIIIEEFHS